MRRPFLLLVAALVAGCAADAPPSDIASRDAETQHAMPPVPTPAPAVDAAPGVSHWQCDELGVMARFQRAPDRVLLTANGLHWTLPIAISASGARYADPAGGEFWTKGASGTLTLEDAPPRECHQVERPSPWNQALLDGLAFRGAGNEPGWSVEVEGGATPALRATLDYGEHSVRVPAAARTAEGYAGTDTDGRAVALRITDARCHDGMSGQPFPATVELVVGETAYNGCGARFDEAASAPSPSP